VDPHDHRKSDREAPDLTHLTPPSGGLEDPRRSAPTDAEVYTRSHVERSTKTTKIIALVLRSGKASILAPVLANW
jgi:hypothetical protein